MQIKRGSGILLHISSLPSRYGVGDLGPSAYRFVDFLAQARQSYWQILPLTPTEVGYGNSPYSSSSAFAGNALFISPELLYQEGYLQKSDLKSRQASLGSKTNYKKATALKTAMLKKAFKKYLLKKIKHEAFKKFCRAHSYWLDDYALFSILKKKYKGKLWNQWPAELKGRKQAAMDRMQKENFLEVEEHKFVQFLFYDQWSALKKYCRKNKISVIGDIPIYVNFDSTQVWKNPKLFKLDTRLNPKFVAGVPPDYFSKTGQRWGNPVYDWKALKKQNYEWWLKRIEHNLKLYDYTRIDHFRGFAAYWEIPAKAKTAINGRWIRVPGHDFFKTVKMQFPKAGIIVEDIGYITPAVKKLIKDTGFPGMKVLQFAFGDDKCDNNYLPAFYPKNCVAYTGTHDNNTIKGWFFNEVTSRRREFIMEYIGARCSEKDLHWQFIELLMRSKANMIIIPLQDIFGLGKETRMNTPATARGNWSWCLDWKLMKPEIARRISAMTVSSRRKQS